MGGRVSPAVEPVGVSADPFEPGHPATPRIRRAVGGRARSRRCAAPAGPPPGGRLWGAAGHSTARSATRDARAPCSLHFCFEYFAPTPFNANNGTLVLSGEWALLVCNLLLG